MPKKKKTNKGGQQFLSPEKFMQTRARTLQIGKCYRDSHLFDIGEGYVVVSRLHTGDKISFACYLVDTYCIGVKDSMYKLRTEKEEFDYMLESLSKTSELEECSYEEAHNIVYGAVDFAEEIDIAPDDSFKLTKYMLEEDTEDVPLIEYEFGKDGKHFLVATDQYNASKYLPKLKQAYGNDFKYIVPENSWIGDDSKYMKHPTYGMDTKYTYKPQRYSETLNVHNEWLVEELNKPENSLWLEDSLINRILALPKEELRSDLEEIIRYVMTITSNGNIPADFDDGNYNGILASSIMLLGEVGNNESSLDLVLECLRQSQDFLDYHFSDSADAVFVPTLYKLTTADRFNKLLSFMKEPGLYSFGKAHVPETMSQIAFRQPELKPACIEWFDDLISFAIEKLPEVQYIDGVLAAHLTSNLIDLRASELLPKIKAMYDTGCIDQTYCGSIDTVEKEISQNTHSSNFDYFDFDVHERFAAMKSRFDKP